jgi:integrase
MGLPDALIGLLRKHAREQAAERDAACQLWREEGWVFATPTGAPLNMNMGHREWKKLVAAAGVRESRLHDARHTAATVLLLLGVPERPVMGVMGWSSTGMAARYQHITQVVRQDIAAQVDGLIWPIAANLQ